MNLQQLIPCDRSTRELAQTKAKLAIQLTNGMRVEARQVARCDKVCMASAAP